MIITNMARLEPTPTNAEIQGCRCMMYLRPKYAPIRKPVFFRVICINQSQVSITSELRHNLHGCLLDLDVSGLDLHSEDLARGVGVGLELTEEVNLQLLLLG